MLDQRYAKQYAEDLEKLKTDDRQIFELLNKQTSVIQATSRIIHANEERTRHQFDVIEFNLEQIKQYNMLEQKRHQIFMDIAIQLIISMSRMEAIQTNLI